MGIFSSKKRLKLNKSGIGDPLTEYRPDRRIDRQIQDRVEEVQELNSVVQEILQQLFQDGGKGVIYTYRGVSIQFVLKSISVDSADLGSPGFSIPYSLTIVPTAVTDHQSGAKYGSPL